MDLWYDMTVLRVVFMGTPDFAVAAFEALCGAGHDMACVYTQPPRPAGRGGQPRPSPVQRAAEARGVAARAPASLKSAEEQAAFKALGADVAVVAAYGLILPKAVLDAPRLGCVNIHASLLPRWRGAAPIQRVIMAGDAVTGITLMRMDEGLDTGPILMRRELTIGDSDAGALHDRLSELGAAMIAEGLEALAAGRLDAAPQPEAGARYAKKLTRADEAIDWTRPAAEVARQVRALAPRPGAHFTLGGETWKVLAAAESDGAAAPGTVLDDHLTVACGNGALRPLTVQRPGRKAMAAAEALRGHPIPPGTVLG
jgi:methionyl-tRNA formyltransferase